MEMWIAAVKHISYRLTQATIPFNANLDETSKSAFTAWLKAKEEEDIILVLTNALSETYTNLIVSLDSMP